MFKKIKNKRIVQLLSGLLLLCILLSGCNFVQTIESVLPSDTDSELSPSEVADVTQAEDETQKPTEKLDSDTDGKNEDKDNAADNNSDTDGKNEDKDNAADNNSDTDGKNEDKDNAADNNGDTDGKNEDKDNAANNNGDTDNKDGNTDIGDDALLVIPAEAPKPASDPYANVNVTAFYDDYEPATSYWDAYYRTLHGLMSGSIAEQDQEPTLADDMPMVNGYYVRNTSALYSEDGNVYYIVDSDGNIVNRVYKGGAYVTLEEVAAYVFAFGEVPANYTSDKKAKPTASKWGVYLRLNHSAFTGDTSRYPYEPELPDISGCGGDLRYYEIDIGTTGTDCDPSYYPIVYNNGVKITRGAARIVYTRYDANGDKIIDVNEKYLFYTYNHYNDFQEYLNYEGGWGEMFGNITGGGTISSKDDYKPTEYALTKRRAFVAEYAYESVTLCAIDVYYYFDKRYAYAA